MRISSGLRNNLLARSARELFTSVIAKGDSPFKSLIRNLEKLSVTTVIDVGANIGQFGLDIRRHGFEGQIVSYEPIEEIFNALSHTVKQYQPWKALQLGLGAAESQRTINVSGNAGLSSSILDMGSLHLENFPDSATVARQNISISTIDKQLEVLGLRPHEIMLKLDVQGFEAEVLKGASQSLTTIPLCFLEVSVVPLYRGEISFLPLLNELSKSGHEVIDVFRGLKAKDGQLLQLDILTKLSTR